MRIRRKNKNQGMPPDQVEALGYCDSADFKKAGRITAQLLGMPPEKVEARPAKLVSPVQEFFLNRFGSPEGRGGDPVRGEDPRPGAERKPPLLIGGESPTEYTTGESPLASIVSDGIVIDRNGNPVIRPGIRCVNGQKVGIDWVSCVFEPSLSWMYCFVAEFGQSEKFVSDDRKIADYVKAIFAWVLGFNKEDETGRWKIYENGLNGYKFAIGMPYRAGLVHVGHSSGTVLVTISGQGAAVAAPGWESRLHRFLVDVKGWLTRIDMAFDDYEGEYFPVRTMREKAKEGCFERGGRPPKIELRGSWEQDDPNNSGLTLYVGSRMSGKFTRIYEKGKQLGDEKSPWVRAEVELHNSCYQLTLAMLLQPTGWFAAFYPCFEVIQYSGNREELEYRKRMVTTTVEHSIKWIRHQAGGHLAALRQLFPDGELLDKLVREEAIPDAFLAANHGAASLLAPSECLTDEPGWLEAGE